MKLNQNKKIHKVFWSSLAIFYMVVSAIILLQPKPAYALGSLCYNPNNGGIQETANSGGEEACRNIGATVINAGDPMPVKICLVGDSVQVMSPTGSEEACTNIGGQVVRQGENLPGYATEEEVQDSKNRANNNQVPDAVTNDDREALRNCSAKNGDSISDAKLQNCLEENPIVGYVRLAINVLSAGVGVLAVIMLIIGGIQYSSAGGDPQKVKAAKNRITNVIIGLIAYFFLFAFLQWVVPGGFF